VAPDITGQIIIAQGSETLAATANFTEFRDIDAEIKIITSEPCVDTFIVKVRGRGLEGEYIYDTDLNFGSVAFCEQSSQTFSLTNTGDPQIEVRSMTILQQGDWQFFTLQGTEPNGFILNKNETYSREIIFSPDNTTEGAKNAVLQTVIYVNAKEDTLLTVLTGTRASGLLSLPEIVDFGTVIVGTTERQTLQLVNIGTRVITINAILPLENYPAIFTIDPPELLVPLTLNPGESEDFEISCTPDNIESYIDILKFTIISPCNETRSVILTAEAIPALSGNIWIPEMEEVPWKRDFRIPLMMSLDNNSEALNDISLQTKIIMNESLFYPKYVSNNGNLDNFYYDGLGNIVMEISGNNLDMVDVSVKFSLQPSV